MKKIAALFLICTLLLHLTACATNIEPTRAVVATQTALSTATQAATATRTAAIESEPTPSPVKYDTDDLDSTAGDSAVSYIRLEGDSIAFEGSGATVDGATVTIASAGTYSISGTLNDGQIIVDTQDKDKVVLVLDGANIACATGAPIYVRNAEKVVITLADGSENYVRDGDAYILAPESDEPNGAIFSHDDLTINGGGSLVVDARYNHGIVSKDDLKITGGTITVNAVNDGLKGRDSIAIKDGVIAITAGGDGLQSNNDVDTEKGYISIEGGTLNIVAGLDGIQAETRLWISGGSITIVSGGGSVNGSTKADWGNWGRPGVATSTDSTPSAKGLKAGVDVTISGGAITIDASDDAIHSNNSLTIGGGEILIASGDDGIHADATLVIDGGNITITQSYEGIESAAITINDGNIRIVASDDGINGAGGVDGSSVGGRPGQNPFWESGNCRLDINGGYIAVDAMGDGIDINGPIEMTGGVVIVNGPTANNNGALDYTGAFNISGGLLVAVGSAGMAQGPSASSTQHSLVYNLAAQPAGTIIRIETQDGRDLLTFAPTKTYQSVVFSSPALQDGLTCIIFTGGSSTGSATDGLYSGGAYTAGTQATSLTLSGIVTGSGGFPGGPGGGRTRPGGRP